MACSRADTTGRSTPNSKRSSAAGRSPGGPSGIWPGSTHDACQSSVQSSPVSNQAGSEAGLSPRSVSTVTRHSTRREDVSGGPAYGTSRLWSLSTQPESQPLSAVIR